MLPESDSSPGKSAGLRHIFRRSPSRSVPLLLLLRRVWQFLDLLDICLRFLLPSLHDGACNAHKTSACIYGFGRREIQVTLAELPSPHPVSHVNPQINISITSQAAPTQYYS